MNSTKVKPKLLLFNARNRRNQNSTPGIILMDENKTGMPTNNTQEV